MRDIEFKNVAKLTKFSLKINKKTIMIQAAILFLFVFMYMVLFPSVQEMASVKLDVLPEEVLALIGTSSSADLSDYNSYFGMIIPIFVLITALVSSIFSSGLLRKEEKTTSIEFLNSLAVSRKEIYLSKYLTSLIQLVFTILFIWIAGIGTGFIVGGESFDFITMVTGLKITSFTIVFFAGVSLAFAGISPKVGNVGVVSLVIFVSYILGYLGTLLGESGEFLRYLSPFVTFNYMDVLTLTNSTMIMLLIYFEIYCLALIFGALRYSKRDLQI